MSDLKQGMKIAEASRETKKHDGYLARLFLGENAFHLLNPFPRQPKEDKEAAEKKLEKIKEFIVKNVDPNTIDREGEIDPNIIAALGYLKIFAVKIPKENGGLGFSQSNYRRLGVMIGSWCSSLSALVSAHNSLGATKPLLEYGTEEQKREFLPRFVKGEISAFALTEIGVGSDPSSMETYAIPVNDGSGNLIGYRLNGEKLYTTNAVREKGEPLGKVIVVIARLVKSPEEIKNNKVEPFYALFLVETGQSGFEVVNRCHFMGFKAIYNGLIRFNNVFIPANRRITKMENGKEVDGFRMALEILTIGRLTVPAMCTGGLKQALRIAHWWASERKQMGQIGKHELVSKMLIDIASRTLATDAITQYCSILADQKKDVRLESAASKIIGTEHLFCALDDLLQIRGGRGYETYDSLKGRGEIPVPVERMYRDCRINRIFEGTNEILRLWTAREGLEEYKKRGEATYILKRLAAIVWMTKQLIKGFMPSLPVFGRHGSHLRFIKREAKRLARDTVIASAYYQFLSKVKLMKKQVVLARIVDRALMLFEMGALIAYAKANSDFPLIHDITDYWCWNLRDKLRPRGFIAWALRGPHKKLYKLAAAIMAGESEWLEEGIIPIELESKKDSADIEAEKIRSPD